MEKWEYLVVDVDAGKTRRVNGQDLENWKTDNLPEFINQPGADGWEMSGVHSLPFAVSYILFFKRRTP